MTTGTTENVALCQHQTSKWVRELCDNDLEMKFWISVKLERNIQSWHILSAFLVFKEEFLVKKVKIV